MNLRVGLTMCPIACWIMWINVKHVWFLYHRICYCPYAMLIPPVHIAINSDSKKKKPSPIQWIIHIRNICVYVGLHINAIESLIECNLKNNKGSWDVKDSTMLTPFVIVGNLRAAEQQATIPFEIFIPSWVVQWMFSLHQFRERTHRVAIEKRYYVQWRQWYVWTIDTASYYVMLELISYEPPSLSRLDLSHLRLKQFNCCLCVIPTDCHAMTWHWYEYHCWE